jgi:hypothetical protein
VPEILPQSVPDFYKYIVFVIFAVVVAQSFPQSVKVFTPITNLTTYDGIQTALVSGMVYSFIFTSWIGYFLSITKNSHKETKLGSLRFAIDLFIIYLFYYLLTLAADIKQHNSIFVWVLPAIFVTFISWDIVKFFEYRNESKDEKDQRINRAIITAIFLVLIVIQSYGYSSLNPVLHPLIFQNNNVWNTVFTITSIVILSIYRWLKRRSFKFPRKSLQTNSS